MTEVIDRLRTALAERYDLERELGAGGMATVYLARDLRHGREVALKVLRPELGAILGAERFLQEISVTAHLQHPHILPLFDSGSNDGLLWYVMPYVQGESLREKLKREKQLSVDEAVRLGVQVGQALDYAHRHSVIHRDIKPENILLHDGQALVADFGIARAVRSAGGNRLTETGLSLGTPGYMSPEQATGDREIDARSDIYSLGCVIYEMLAGEPPHAGPTSQSVIAKLMTEEPRPISAVRRTVPAHVAAAIHHALEKLPADRFASAGEFADALLHPGRVAIPVPEVGKTGSREDGKDLASRPSVLPSSRLAAWLGLALAITTALAAWGWLRARPAPAVPTVARFAVQLPPNAPLALGSGPNIALSPDGSRIVYDAAGPGGLQLYLRGLDQLDPVPLAGTQNAVNPFFSPDGQWLAYYSGGKLYKLPLAGGPPLTIANVSVSSIGGSWGPDEAIVFASELGLLQVPATGGEPRLLLKPDSGQTYLFPEYLPNGRALVFQIRGSTGDRLAALELRSGKVKRFEQAGSNPHYISSGHLVLATRAGTLLAVPFDAARLEITGSAVPVAEGVVVGNSGVAKMGVSRNGAFAYTSGAGGLGDLVMVDRSGTARALPRDPQGFLAPRLSPDGKRIAVQINESGTGNSDIWIYDLAQHTRTRVTFDQSGQRPIWTPDGRQIIYSKGDVGAVDLYRIPADGSAPAESLFTAPDDQWAGAVTPDGQTLVFRAGAGGSTKRSLHFVALNGKRVPQPFLDNQFDNHSPSLSPDGRWVAYVSDQSGRPEVYVRPFPGPGGLSQISLDGGSEPRWSPAGNEIFYRAGNRMIAAAVQLRPSFAVGERKPLFEGNYVTLGIYPNYDVTRDGKNFVMVRPPGGQGFGFIVVLHWFDQLRGGARAGGSGGR